MRKPKLWKTEAAFAAELKTVLESQGYTVYPELDGIDMVCTKPDPSRAEGVKVLGVECKLTMNLKVFQQARKHYDLGIVHEPWVAFPHQGTDCNEVRQLVEAFKVGAVMLYRKWNSFYLDPDKDDTLTPMVHWVTPRPQPISNAWALDQTMASLGSDRLVGLMQPEATRWTDPGRASPIQWTKYRQQELKMAQYAKAHPGCDLVEALAHVFPPKLNKFTGLPKKVPKSKIDFMSWMIRSGKARLIKFVSPDTRTIAPTELLDVLCTEPA